MNNTEALYFIGVLLIFARKHCSFDSFVSFLRVSTLRWVGFAPSFLFLFVLGEDVCTILFFLLFVDCVLFCAYYPLLIELQRYISGRNLVDDAHIRPHSFLIRLFPLFNLFQVWRPLFCQPIFLLLPVLSTPFHSSQWRLRITCSPPAWRIRAGPATS